MYHAFRFVSFRFVSFFFCRLPFFSAHGLGCRRLTTTRTRPVGRRRLLLSETTAELFSSFAAVDSKMMVSLPAQRCDGPCVSLTMGVAPYKRSVSHRVEPPPPDREPPRTVLTDYCVLAFAVISLSTRLPTALSCTRRARPKWRGFALPLKRRWRPSNWRGDGGWTSVPPG